MLINATISDQIYVNLHHVYSQGMNELVGTMYYVFASKILLFVSLMQVLLTCLPMPGWRMNVNLTITRLHAPFSPDDSVEQEWREHAEADTFFCFSILMSEFRVCKCNVSNRMIAGGAIDVLGGRTCSSARWTTRTPVSRAG